MPDRLTAMLTLLLSLSIFPFTCQAEIIKIGVLSGQNFSTTIKQWSTTTSYLKQQLPQHIFQILPYSEQADLVTDLEKNKLDLLLTRKHNLTRLMTNFSLHPILNIEKSHTKWILARHHSLPYTVSYSISNALLQQATSLEVKNGDRQWVLSSDTDVQLSVTQKIKQRYNQFVNIAADILNQHWKLLIAALLSAILILVYRQWDRHHTRLNEINKHQQQPRDPSLSDTVF